MFTRAGDGYSCEELLKQAYNVKPDELEKILNLIENKILFEGHNRFLARAKSIITTRILLKSEKNKEIASKLLDKKQVMKV